MWIKQAPVGVSRTVRLVLLLLFTVNLLTPTSFATDPYDLLAQPRPVVCWGDNGDGQATPPQGLSAVQVVPGWYDTCALLSEQGSVQCWGNNRGGLHNIQTSGAYLKQISVGYDVACGVMKTDSSLRCYGNTNSAVLSQMPGPLNYFSRLHLGSSFGCGLKTDGTILCWGNNATGVLAAPSGTYSQLSAGDQHACAISQGDSSITCWGHNYYGQLNVPQSEFSQVCAGYSMTCGLFKSNGTARCWPGLPGQPPATQTYSAIACGWSSACGILSSGDTVCWGNNQTGQAAVPTGQGQFSRVMNNHYFTICGLVAPSPSASPSPSITPSRSSTPSTTPSFSPSPSGISTPSPSPSVTPSPSPSSTVTPSSARTPFPTASVTSSPSSSASKIPPSPSSPSSSAVPSMVPLTNVTANFDEEQPTVTLVSKENTGVADNGTAVAIATSDVLFGNSSASISAYEVSSEESNSSSTYIYRTSISSSSTKLARATEDTILEQRFIFHRKQTAYEYQGFEFIVPESAIKWTIAINSSEAFGASVEGIKLRYQLSTVSTYASDSSTLTFVRLRNHPREGISTYILPSSSTSSSASDDRLALSVEVFDTAIVDDVEGTPIEHAVRYVALTQSAHAYVMELKFPAFNRSLFYDPSLSLGRLVGSDPSSSGGGGPDVGLIVGATVAVCGAVVVIVVVVAVALIVARQRRVVRRKQLERKLGRRTEVVSFRYDDLERKEDDL